MQAESTKQIKTSDLEGEALDWAVWKIEHSSAKTDDELILALSTFKPSSNWSQAGPIIEREGITLRVNASMMGHWVAFIDFGGSSCNIKARQKGSTVLIAAMRCYVASKLGDVVEVPNELVLTCN